MVAKVSLLIAVIIVCFTPMAPAELGAFGGNVYYTCGDCDYNDNHQIWVRKAGQDGDYHRVKNAGQPYYATTGYDYTAGWYYVSAVGLSGTGCTQSVVQYVYYSGTGPIEVHVTIMGDCGGGSSPPGGLKQ